MALARLAKKAIEKPNFTVVIFKLLPVFLVSWFFASTAPGGTPEKPNIIVVVVDDWGNGDLSIYGVLDDIKTPNLDRLAKEGVLFTDGYITSPQCAPSRAGLMTGRYQQRFGFDNINSGPLPLSETTLADRLGKAGYITGHIGKWHLEPNAGTVAWALQNHPEMVVNNRVRTPLEIVVPFFPHNRGFDYFMVNNMSPYYGNFTIDGEILERPRRIVSDGFRVEDKTKAAVAFIERHKSNPFFLHVAYFAPHTPLEATQKYLDRFPGEMKERRRYGLAIMSAVDDGIGDLMRKLEEEGLRDKTLIFFISDNGAPLGGHWAELMEDIHPPTASGRAWCGSRNDPFRGEKGMLSEGGLRVPFIASWPAGFPSGQTFIDPVISLDIAATANAAAGLAGDPALDGVNLLPFLRGEKSGAPHEHLYFRFWGQAAIRSGDWKLIQARPRHPLLFNLREDKEENDNLVDKYPERVKAMRSQLQEWTNELQPTGLPQEVNNQEIMWYQYWFNLEL